MRLEYNEFIKNASSYLREALEKGSDRLMVRSKCGEKGWAIDVRQISILFWVDKVVKCKSCRDSYEKNELIGGKCERCIKRIKMNKFERLVDRIKLHVERLRRR